MPPGYHAVGKAANTIALIVTDHSPLYRSSADLLLTSLALTAAERTIAVVLSGHGNDGAAGADQSRRAGLAALVACDHRPYCPLGTGATIR